MAQRRQPPQRAGSASSNRQPRALPGQPLVRSPEASTSRVLPPLTRKKLRRVRTGKGLGGAMGKRTRVRMRPPEM